MNNPTPSHAKNLMPRREALMSSLRGLYASILFVGTLLIVNSCEEFLPEYRDPGDVLGARQEAHYTLTQIDNSLKITVIVVNMFDETFDGRAFFAGTVVISLADDPAFRKTFLVTAENVLSGKYSPATQQLRLDPGDSLKLQFSWNFVDDRGQNLRDILHYKVDVCCRQRLASDPITVNVRSEVKVFEKINPVLPQLLSHTFVHYQNYVNTNNCLPLPNHPECN